MRTLIQLKSDVIDAEKMAEVHKEVWLDYEHEAEDVRAEVERREDRKGIRGLVSKLVCVVLLLVFIGGCQAFAGASRDAEWSFRKLGDMAEKAKLEDR